MVKNTGGGSKHKKMASKIAKFKPKTLFAIKEQGMMYAKVLKKLGGTHIQVLATNSKTLTAKISGTMRKRKWINVGDIVLVSPRDFETNQDNCDILYCYDQDEAKNLVSMGEIAFEINQKTDDIKFDNIGVELNDTDDSDKSLNEEDDLPVNTNHAAPIKTGKDIKSRNNKQDEKMTRIENFTHEDDE
jgi:translation initiation factor 1A